MLNTTLQREGDFLRQKGTTCEAEVLFSEGLDLLTVQGGIPNFTGERASHLQNKFSHMIQCEVRN